MPRLPRRAALLFALTLVATAVPTGVADASIPPAFGYGTPAYVTSAAPSSFVFPDGSGEPSIGDDWKTGAAMYMSGSDVYKINFDNTQNPPAASWTDLLPLTSEGNLDPILATDPTSGITLAGGDDGACAVMSRTTDDGDNWTPTLPCPFAADHPTVGFGPAVGSTVPTGLPAGSTGLNAYFCQQSTLNTGEGPVPAECSRSLDGGQTWSPAVPNQACVFQFGHVKAAPNGTVYVPAKQCTDSAGRTGIGGFKSTDGGLNWTGYVIPNAPISPAGFDPSVGVDTAGTVYESWTDARTYHPMIASSSNGGTTWTAPLDLASTASPSLAAATFQAVVAGDAGRVAIAYLGSSEPVPAGKSPFAAGYHGLWYLYVSTSYDGGKTWTTVKATPTLVQRGEIDAGGTLTAGQRNLLDFMDATVTKDGRVLVGFADGCLAACEAANGTEADSTDAYATIAYQSTGRGLFSAYDVNPVTPPDAPQLTATAGPGQVALSWTTPNDNGAPITGYEVNRGLAPGAETPYQSVTGTSFVDTNVTAGTTYYYTVTATNSAGTSNASNEASGTPPTVPAAPTLNTSASGQQVNLSWTAPASDGGSAITGYEVNRGTTPGTETAYQSVSGTATTFTDSSTTLGTTYYYTVSAINAVGNGASSNEGSATPANAPNATTLTVTAGRGQAALSWTAPSNGGAAITGYAIYRATKAGAETLYQTIGATITSYVDNQVTAGTTYFYEVAAVNRVGVGALSNEASATVKHK